MRISLLVALSIVAIASAFPQWVRAENHSSLVGYFHSLAEDQQLHEHPTWRRLLHYRANAKRSEVNSLEFFLSPTGGKDPEAELRATITAYFQSDEESDEAARCRFPARYYWLSQQLELPDYEIAPAVCSRLSRWDLLENTKSVSMYWVSGYFGNPASSFGHALLKLNSGNTNQSANQLLDLTVSFGALVPENEMMLLYILKGLGGGYQAGFSDQYYFTQDQVYSRTEFRDIWDYKLNLSEEQRTLLILHIWEVIGKKYTYYFAKENCAFRLATLLELVLEEPLVDRRPWYVPIDLFNRLNQIDETLKAAGKARLIESIKPIPSSRRVLYSKFASLSPSALALANSIIRAGTPIDLTGIEAVDMDEQLDVLDALLAYLNYKELSQIQEPKPEIQVAKKDILMQRLRRPVRVSPELDTQLKNAPTTNTPPLYTSFGLAANASGALRGRFTFSPFSQGSLGYNATLGSDMTVVRTTFGLDEHEVFLDQVDLIDVRKLALERAPVSGENAMSWQAKLGARRSRELKRYPNEWYARASYGKSWLLAKNHALSAFAGVAFSNIYDPVRIRPELQWAGGSNLLRYDIYAAGEIGESKDFDILWGAAFQLNLDRRKAIRVQFESHDPNRASASFVWSW